MKRILCSIVCCWASILLQEAQGAPNLINVVTEEKAELDQQVITENATWKVSCSGHSPLEWEYPYKESKDRITFTSTQQKPFVTTLELSNAHFLDTGEYSCKYKVKCFLMLLTLIKSLLGNHIIAHNWSIAYFSKENIALVPFKGPYCS